MKPTETLGLQLLHLYQIDLKMHIAPLKIKGDKQKYNSAVC